MRLKSVLDLLGHAARAIGAGHMPVARAPERHGVDQRLAENDLLRCGKRRAVEHPPVRPRQIKMVGRALPQIVVDFATVEIDHAAFSIEQRHDQRATQVFVPALPQHAQRHQPAAHVGPGLAVGLRQAIAQRPVREAQLKVLDQLRMHEATPLQIGKRLRGAFQGRVVIAHDLAHQRRILRRRREGGEFGHGGFDCRGRG